MREIKFRGKVNGSWQYVTPESGWWDQFWALVDRETVGEYTGLKDYAVWEKVTTEEQERWLKSHTKEEWKGREVYEGDVLYSNGFIGTVYWDQSFAAWRAKRIGTLAGMPLEIIGNTHDVQEKQCSQN